MQLYSTIIPISKEHDNRHSLPILTIPIQSLYIRENIFCTPIKPNRTSKKPLHRLSQLTLNHYEAMKKMSYEIDFLTEKLFIAEEKAYKWKKEIKDLQLRFMQIQVENTKIKEELDTTRRMLKESEHIRSRWFIKTPQEVPYYQSIGESNRKSPPLQHQSLPNNLLRFLKLNNTRK